MRPIAAATVTLLALASMTSLLLATAQAPDYLQVANKEYAIYTNPLEPFLSLHPDKRPSPEVISTGLWRHYIASWEVSDNRLLLVDIEIETHSDDADSTEHAPDRTFRSVMSDVFSSPGPVFAEWYTGHVIIPQGKRVKYLHMGYGSTFKKYLVLTFKQGLLSNERTMTRKQYEAFRMAQFEAFQQTDEFQAALEQLKNDFTARQYTLREQMPTLEILDQSEEEHVSFMFDYYAARYTSILFVTTQ